MEIENKIELLNKLDTKKLIADLKDQENRLESLMLEASGYKLNNIQYLASFGDDCSEVENILADLTIEQPLGADGKKMSVSMLEAWLRQQRSKNTLLKVAIQRQTEVAFAVENDRTHIEMAKKRIESLKAILALRTAQIEFLK